ncbi:hypothetical protein [Thermococcus thermotolerans]|uniref:hypothetical protein n=1 Tax=Thermococcus thermotolerans TaxID=2969672 RepID=UPI0021583701|nr:hypothetical protein [Thermococcus thermotolerans]
MRFSVLKERESTVGLIFMLIFELFLLALLAFIIFNVDENRIFTIGVFAFFLLITLSGIRALMKKRREYRRAENFANLANFSESEVTFPEELELERGTLEIRGYWVRSGRNRRYQVERKFLPGERKRASRVPFMGSPFKVAVSPDGTGFVKAPAVRITDGLYKNVLVLFFTDEGEVRGSGTVTVATESDSVQINFRGDGKFIRGMFTPPSRKGRALR